jgi:hypothetical protein
MKFRPLWSLIPPLGSMVNELTNDPLVQTYEAKHYFIESANLDMFSFAP